MKTNQEISVLLEWLALTISSTITIELLCDDYSCNCMLVNMIAVLWLQGRGECFDACAPYFNVVYGSSSSKQPALVSSAGSATDRIAMFLQHRHDSRWMSDPGTLSNRHQQSASVSNRHQHPATITSTQQLSRARINRQ